MSGASALKKINARVKKLAKRYPGKKRTTLQKQAGAEYRAGKLKARKTRKVKKTVKRKKRRPAAKKVHRRKKTVVRRKKTRRRVPGVTPKRRKMVKGKRHTKWGRIKSHRRRISGMGKSGKILLIGALAVGAYLLLRPKASQTIYVPTGNTYRDSTAQTIISIAQAAGIVGAQLTKLIQTINASNDAQVQALHAAAATSPGSLGDDSRVQQILSNSGTGVARIMG